MNNVEGTETWHLGGAFTVCSCTDGQHRAHDHVTIPEILSAAARVHALEAERDNAAAALVVAKAGLEDIAQRSLRTDAVRLQERADATLRALTALDSRIAERKDGE